MHQIEEGKPGSACPKGYLVSNREFTDKPICTASKQYQALKLKALGHDTVPAHEGADKAVKHVYVKQCICDQLGNGALIQMGVASPSQPVSVCPGPNIAYFDRLYSLREMVAHIYGSGPSLVPENRPHMFAKDLRMYLDYYEKLVKRHLESGDPTLAYLSEFKANIESGIRYYDPIFGEAWFLGENPESLRTSLREQSARLESIWSELPIATTPVLGEISVVS